MKASATIEVTYIMPVILLVFMVAVHSGFYYHDKNILQGTIYEATIIGAQQYRLEDSVDSESVRLFVEEKCKGKLLFFNLASLTIKEEKNEVRIEATMKKRGMSIKIQKSMPLLKQENHIRDLRRVKGL